MKDVDIGKVEVGGTIADSNSLMARPSAIELGLVFYLTI